MCLCIVYYYGQIISYHVCTFPTPQVLDTPCQTNIFHYDCCPEPYPDVTCQLVIRRRPAFYLFNLVLPTVLLLIIGLLVFCLPPESGEKVGYS